MGRNNEEEDIFLENAEELDNLEYSSEEMHIFKNIRVTKKDFSIYELRRKYINGTLILDVNFQRRNVWLSKQKCELIESILMGLPLPIFYFKQLDNANYVVVDGKQRLSALFEFLDDEFPLKNLNILKNLNGKKFSQFKDSFGNGIFQSQLEDYQVYSHLILPPTPDKILFDIFDRVNRGGTKLNKQEIRNALYQGRGLDMINDIALTEEFFQATNISPGKDKRMKAEYLITRYISFFLYFNGRLDKKENVYTYNGDIDNLIENSLKYLNSCNSLELENIRNIVIGSLRKIFFYFDTQAFRKNMDPAKPINMNIFETTMFLMSYIPFNDEKLKTKLHNLILNTITNEIYLDSIGNGRDSTRKVNIRFDLMKNIIKEIEND